jgi:hypothetical protein
MSNEDNRFSARAARYVKVGTNVGAVAARVAAVQLGRDVERAARDHDAIGDREQRLDVVARAAGRDPQRDAARLLGDECSGIG